MRKPLTIACLLPLCACLSETLPKQDYHGFAPRELHDGWTPSTPEAEGIDRALLEQAFLVFYEDEKLPMADALLVARNGRLVAEAYARDDADIARANPLQSATKSFTSMLAGIALSRGYLPSIDVPLHDLYPEHFDADVRKRTMTLRDALSMRTGLDFDNDEDTAELFSTDGSTVEFVLHKPFVSAPGLAFNYSDGAPQLVSAAIQKGSGRPMDELAAEALFAPLGISEWTWERGGDGTTWGAFGLHLRPRDLARVGVMLADGGRYGGAQILDPAWIASATEIQATPARSPPYGHYFWLYPQYGGFAAMGHGGQMLVVIPDKQLVIAYTAWPFTGAEFFGNFTEVLDLVVAACP